MRWLFALWALLMVAATPFVPAYRGNVADEGSTVAVEVILIAALAVVMPPRSVGSRREALVHAIPVVILAGIALVAGLMQNEANTGVHGETVYLYFGWALLCSWCALAVLSALLVRTKWTAPGYLAIAVLAGIIGFLNLTVRID
jgi:hypothetical protein